MAETFDLSCLPCCDEESGEQCCDPSGPLTATITGCAAGSISLTRDGPSSYTGSGTLSNGKPFSIEIFCYDPPTGWQCNITSGDYSNTITSIAVCDPMEVVFGFQFAGPGTPCGDIFGPSESMFIDITE